jgi:hypothetical protein
VRIDENFRFTDKLVNRGMLIDRRGRFHRARMQEPEGQAQFREIYDH